VKVEEKNGRAGCTKGSEGGGKKKIIFGVWVTIKQ